MQQKNYERAVEHFDQSISLKSDQPLAYFQMGMAYLYLNEPPKAEQAAEPRGQVDPTNPGTLPATRIRLISFSEIFPIAEAAAKQAISLSIKMIWRATKF